MGTKWIILSAHELHCPELNSNNQSPGVYETGLVLHTPAYNLSGRFYRLSRQTSSNRQVPL